MARAGSMGRSPEEGRRQVDEGLQEYLEQERDKEKIKKAKEAEERRVKEAEGRKAKEAEERRVKEAEGRKRLEKEYSDLVKEYSRLFGQIRNLDQKYKQNLLDKLLFKIQELDAERHRVHLKLEELGRHFGKGREDILFDLIREERTLEEYGLPEFSVLRYDDIVSAGNWRGEHHFNLGPDDMPGEPLASGAWEEKIFSSQDEEDALKYARGPVMSEDECMIMFAVTSFINLGSDEIIPHDFIIRIQRSKMLAEKAGGKFFSAVDSRYHDISASISGVIFPKRDLEGVINIIRNNPEKFRLGDKFYSKTEKEQIYRYWLVEYGRLIREKLSIEEYKGIERDNEAIKYFNNKIYPELTRIGEELGRDIKLDIEDKILEIKKAVSEEKRAR